MPVRHLHGRRAARERQQLMAETDAERRQPRLHQFLYGADRVVARLRIAWAVRQEHAVGLEIEHLRGGRLCRHDGDVAAAIGQQPQNVPLHAEVVCDDAERVRGRHPITFAQLPAAAAPLMRDAARHFGCQVGAFEPGKRARRVQSQRLRRKRLRVRPRCNRTTRPFVRINRVSRRVSISAIATTRSDTRYCASVICCRQLLDRIGRSRITRPAAQTRSDSTSSEFVPVLPMCGYVSVTICPAYEGSVRIS